MSLAVFIVLCGALLWITPDKAFSERENRALAERPKITLTSLKTEKFFEDIRDFFSDQFPNRALFISLKAKSELALGKLENNGVILADDGYLITSPRYDTLSLYEKNLRAIQSFTQKRRELGDKVSVFFAPRGADVLSAKLDPSFPKSDLLEVWNIAKAAIPDLFASTESLRARATNSECVWFRTDHHWTTLGAYEAYLALADALGYTPYPKEHWEFICVSEDFAGTIYSRSGLCKSALDSVYIPRSEQSFTVTYHAENKTTTSLYDVQKLSTKDKYSVFLGGNFAHISIISDTARPRLTLIKDSFANALIPYLAEHFELEIYDLRYFKGSINKELSQNESSDILILYGIDTAITDGSLGLLSR